MKNELITKEIDFNGDLLMATQNNEDGKIYVGLSWVCNGIGFTKHQKDRQISNVQTDIVLKQGCLKFEAGVFDPNNKTIAIELDYLPLWLAKISITPSMVKEKPDVTQKLISYQLKAKDVLANAFIHKDEVNIDNFQIPTTLSEALQLSADLAKENEEMKPKVEQFDLYLKTDGTLSLNQSAKALKTRRNKMMAFLRYKDVLNEDNSPSDYYARKGYFEVTSFTVVMKKNKKFQVAVTRVTSKGQDFLYRYLKKNKEEYVRYDKDFCERLGDSNA